MVRPDLNKKGGVKNEGNLLLPMAEISSEQIITGLFFDSSASGQMVTLKRMLTS